MIDSCPKAPAPCVCADAPRIATRLHLLVLQHPREQDRALGSACIVQHVFERATLKTGLSWPNLGKAVGRPVEPRRWAALYLGARHDLKDAEGPIVAVDRDGAPLAEQGPAFAGLEGLVLLDGAWQQAKALWWRNPWLLKLRRYVLLPPARSLYGKLRREPRREALSTLEAAALAVATLERRPDVYEQALTPFRALLDQHRPPPAG